MCFKAAIKPPNLYLKYRSLNEILRWLTEWTLYCNFSNSRRALCVYLFLILQNKVILSLARIRGFQSVVQLLWKLCKTVCSPVIKNLKIK